MNKFSITKIMPIAIALVWSWGINLDIVHATPVTLTSGNSTATIDPTSQNGMSDWTVDGVDYLAQQWFWIASPQGDPQVSIDQVSAPDPTATGFLNGSTNEFLTRYGSSDTYWVDITYQLMGGVDGSGQAQIHETIEFTNNSQSPLSFYFYQFSDFELDPINGDAVTIAAGTATQTGGGVQMAESVSTTIPGTFFSQAGIGSSTLDALNSSPAPLFLLGPNSAGPGEDVTWAFQWAFILGDVGSQFSITKTKTIDAPSSPTNPIPEPSTVVLFGSGLFLVGISRQLFRKNTD